MAVEPLENFLRFKRTAEKWRSEHDRLLGAKEQLLRRLQTEQDIGSTEEAAKLLKKLKKESEQLAKQFQDALTDLNRRYERKL